MNTKNLIQTSRQENFPKPLKVLVKKPLLILVSLTKKTDMKTVRGVWRENHEGPGEANVRYLVIKEFSKNLWHDQSIFEASMIRKSAIKIHGNLGPSGFDANESRKPIKLFKASICDLCKKTAKLSISMLTSHLTIQLTHISCWLIVLDKMSWCTTRRGWGSPWKDCWNNLCQVY